MALQQCYECGKTVSSRASACPHCGAPVKASAPPDLSEESIEMARGQFYVLQGDEETGPFTMEQVWEMYVTRKFDAQITFFASPGMSEWLPLGRIVQMMFPTSQPPRPEQPVKDQPSKQTPVQDTLQNLAAGFLRSQLPGLKPLLETSREAIAPKSVSPSPKVSGMSTAKNVGAGCLAVVGLFFLIGAIGILMESPNESANRIERGVQTDAYFAAETFIKSQFPGAKSVSALKSAVFDRNGENYLVGVNVDGLNSFGGPIRNSMIVEMRSNNGRWELIQIHQR